MSKATKTGPITVDTQLSEVVMGAAAARVKLIRAREASENGVSRTTLSDVCRDILLGWNEDQTQPRVVELPELVKCMYCQALVGMYDNGKLRSHGPSGKRCPTSYFNPTIPRSDAYVLDQVLQVPDAFKIPVSELPERAACPTCGYEAKLGKEGKLYRVGHQECPDWWFQAVPVSVRVAPPGVKDKKMRFPMNRQRYEAVADRIEEAGQSVAWVLERRLEHFARTGEVT